MAITPRAIFTSPAPAVVAAVSLLSVSALGTMAYQMSSSCPSSQQAVVAYNAPANVCDSVAEALGADRTTWSEFNWFTYTACYERENDSRRVVEVASQGLRYFPRSEALFNAKGYHQIALGQHSEAVATLSLGLSRVGAATTGTLPNNLAWAGLWVPREMELDRARSLYRQALRYDGTVCEILHTGLWVEFGIARESTGFTRYEALRTFSELRDGYAHCHSRVHQGDWQTLVELLGAGVLFQMVDDGVFTTAGLDVHAADTNDLLTDVATKLQQRFRGSSIDALCRDAMPLATVHHACTSLVEGGVANLWQRDRMDDVRGHNRRGLSTRELRQILDEESLRQRKH